MPASLATMLLLLVQSVPARHVQVARSSICWSKINVCCARTILRTVGYAQIRINAWVVFRIMEKLIRKSACSVLNLSKGVLTAFRIISATNATPIQLKPTECAPRAIKSWKAVSDATALTLVRNAPTAISSILPQNYAIPNKPTFYYFWERFFLLFWRPQSPPL